MTALATFLATAKRIEDLLGELPRVRDWPDAAVRSVERVEIRPSEWDDRRPDLLNSANAARALQKALTEMKRTEGEAARDARLAEIAEELRVIRLGLAAQAAAVAIELGHQARMLQNEANGGTL